MTTFRIVLALLTPVILLAGCGSDGDTSAEGESANECGSAFNPATAVYQTLSNFNVTEPARLDRTLFHDVILGVQPASSEDPAYQAVADAVKVQTARFNGGEPETGTNSYASVRNPLDLISLMIGEDQVENFNEGRRYISDCIDAGNPAEYSTSANGKLVTFEEVQNETVTDRYNYPVVRWVYAPDASGKVQRVIRYQGRSGEDLQGALVGWQYNARDFSSIGFNRPELLKASFTAGNNQQRLSLEQAFIGMDKDQWLRSSDISFDFAGEAVDCARIVVDYRAQTAELFTSRSDCTSEECRDEYVAGNAYCGNLAEGTGETYSTQPVADRLN
ncbi:hypothetical protein RE428_01980 [Marinobacter nanhaiticus D15-8W]|uniref:Lipoprotein n=1 Tax=Marinobacter nanhaiticus D15-8W TaxID=626887 RepID=N6WUB0_9GAMM|nr:hypothetical protein [Marinobacter nanhaiticus]ENO15121.1 hypothetical protein J057_07221 [Marinobacter nanhaiticus D15-8W]BES69180.1 hypothetical protein RE428_01980 [Marinobacter nanhaiticus D15-8W]